MKIVLTTVSLIVLIVSFAVAQIPIPHRPTFYVQNDTMVLNALPGNISTAQDNIIIPGSGRIYPATNVAVQWNVVYSNFPSDWLKLSGFCDNENCYTNDHLWPSSSTHKMITIYNSTPFSKTIPFYLSTAINANSTPGLYFITVKFENLNSTQDIAYETFKVDKETFIGRLDNENVDQTFDNTEVLLYPNPSYENINISYEGNNVKRVEIYNIEGKLISTYQFQANITTIDLKNYPDGLYYVRLIKDDGSIITKKFSHY